MNEPPSRDGFYGQRPSKSHDALRERELARIAAMTARERVIEALALGEELAELLPSDERSDGEERQDRDP